MYHTQFLGNVVGCDSVEELEALLAHESEHARTSRLSKVVKQEVAAMQDAEALAHVAPTRGVIHVKPVKPTKKHHTVEAVLKDRERQLYARLDKQSIHTNNAIIKLLTTRSQVTTANIRNIAGATYGPRLRQINNLVGGKLWKLVDHKKGGAYVITNPKELQRLYSTAMAKYKG